MKKIIFDTNIYDQIAAYPEIIKIIRSYVETNKIEIIVTMTIIDELRKSLSKAYLIGFLFRKYLNPYLF
jgi:predicted nucleic acid-binding protein